jgi:hypothetical protein
MADEQHATGRLCHAHNSHLVHGTRHAWALWGICHGAGELSNGLKKQNNV